MGSQEKGDRCLEGGGGACQRMHIGESRGAGEKRARGKVGVGAADAQGIRKELLGKRIASAGKEGQEISVHPAAESEDTGRTGRRIKRRKYQQQTYRSHVHKETIGHGDAQTNIKTTRPVNRPTELQRTHREEVSESVDRAGEEA